MKMVCKTCMWFNVLGEHHCELPVDPRDPLPFDESLVGKPSYVCSEWLALDKSLKEFLGI